MDKKTFKASEWLDSLRSYREYEDSCKRLVKFRAFSFGVLILSSSMILFVLSASPEFSMLWLFMATGGISVALPFSIILRSRLRRCESQKHELARQFFVAGLRVEEDSLVTNEPHPKVVVALNNIAA